DDAVDVTMLASEAQEAFEGAALTVEAILGASKGRTDGILHLRRHVAHQRLEQCLFGIKVGIEGAERDSRSLRDSDDRTIRETPLAEFLAGGIEYLAQGSLAARRPRGFSGGGAQLRLFVDLCP